MVMTALSRAMAMAMTSGCPVLCRPTSSIAFYDSLHAFLEGDGVTFEKDVVFSNHSAIASSVYHAFFTPLPTAPEQVKKERGRKGVGGW